VEDSGSDEKSEGNSGEISSGHMLRKYGEVFSEARGIGCSAGIGRAAGILEDGRCGPQCRAGAAPDIKCRATTMGRAVSNKRKRLWHVWAVRGRRGTKQSESPTGA
jgi:hypothetical protein